VIDLDQDADMGHAEIGYSFAAPWSPRIALQYDHASGDRSPADLDNERFDSLFGDRSFEFGPTSIYGAISRTNLSSPGIRLEVKPDKASDAYVMVRRIGLESATDSFANSGVRDAAGLSGDEVGTQVEGRYRRWLVQDSLRLTLGGAYIARGAFLEDAPNTTGEDDPLFGYAEVQWTF
jgi:Alginate export